jgi:hypothetical protein
MMITLGFMFLTDFIQELEARGLFECRMQPLIHTDPLNSPIYNHVWAVVLTACDHERDEVLALRIAVTEERSGFPVAPVTLHEGRDADLAQAADAIAQALGSAGISVRPGYYHHDDIGYGAALGLWHYQGERLVLGEPDLSEEITDL